MEPQGDAEARIAELERQLAQERRIAELERQLAQARTESPPGPFVAGVTAGVAAGMAGVADADDVDDILESLRSLGFRAVDPRATPRTPPDIRLSPAPRSVPLRFMLAEALPFRWWYLFAMFLVAVPAVIAWITVPAAALPAAVLTVVVIYAWHLVGTRTRLRLLKWGQVATVVGSEIASRASYYGGTTWYNAPLPVANGWQVTRPLWSGPSITTRIRYEFDGYQGDLTVSGREYVDGVVLADQRHPERARCITYFPYDLDRDDAGDWVGRLRPRLVAGMVIWLIVLIGWLAGAAAISTGYATRALQHAQTITVNGGDSTRIAGNSLTRQVVCHDGNLTVDGNRNVVTVAGHCASLTVSGINNTVTIDAADTISISGIDGHVTYHSGTPRVTNNGIDNVVVAG